MFTWRDRLSRQSCKELKNTGRCGGRQQLLLQPPTPLCCRQHTYLPVVAVEDLLLQEWAAACKAAQLCVGRWSQGGGTEASSLATIQHLYSRARSATTRAVFSIKSAAYTRLHAAGMGGGHQELLGRTLLPSYLTVLLNSTYPPSSPATNSTAQLTFSSRSMSSSLVVSSMLIPTALSLTFLRFAPAATPAAST